MMITTKGGEILVCVPTLKSLAQVFAYIYKCSSSSQTNKYRYKLKSNQKIMCPKILELILPRCVPTFKSLAQVFAYIYKCSSSSKTIKYRALLNLQKYSSKILVWPPINVYQVCRLYCVFNLKKWRSSSSCSRTK